GKLIVIGATNRPDAVDPALRRPGRFDREIVIGVPDRNGRKEILQIHTRGMPLHWITPEEKKWEDLDLLSKVDELIKRAKEINSDIDVNEIDREKIDEKIKDFKKFKIVLARSKDSKSVLKSEDKANIEREVTNFKKFLRDLDLLSRADALIKRAEDIKADSHVDKGEREKIDKKIKDLKRVLASGDKDNIEGEVEDFEKFVKEKEVEVYIIEEYADRTHGFVGADLESLCKESAMSALRRILPEIDLKEETIPPEVLEKLEVTQKDFHEAFKNIEPSALREVFIEVSNVRWKDIGGLKDVKRDLREMVEWPIKNPQMFTKMGIKPPKGILLFGPPGTGKTLLAKAVANESEANFISVKGPEVLSKWVGESEKAVREIFKKAKQAAPTIIFFDEVDAIVSQRGVEVGTRVGERLVNQLLTEMDGLEELHNVVVIAATNRPDMLDPGLLRPGRIDRRMMIPAPDEDARKEIFKVHTRNMPLRKDVDMERLAKRTDGYVGADIESICREAAMLAIREVLEKGADVDKKKVELRHFDKAMEIVKPSVSKEWKKFYERFLETYEAREPEQLGYMR
ncbi:MAG: AAA family ATPase, partial [Candidatus Zixiibacteriota bacterium]